VRGYEVQRGQAVEEWEDDMDGFVRHGWLLDQ
jgi:hypothetical protein